MIARKSERCFYISVRDCRYFRPCDIPASFGGMLAQSNLVDSAYFGSIGRSRLVRMAVVQKPKRRLVGGWA